MYDVQDIWPESAVLSGLLKAGWLVRAMSLVERFVYRQAEFLLVVTEGARKNLIAKGVDPAKIFVTPHWIDEDLFAERDETVRATMRAKYDWGNQFVVLFAGNIGLVQGLEAVVRAASYLLSDEAVLLALVGDGADKSRLQKLTQSLDLGSKIQFIERQPMDRMPDFMAASDALLVHLKRSELSQYVLPTKTLAYLAAGKPIIMAMGGAAAQLISTAGAGVVVPPEDPVHLARAIRELRAMSSEARETMGRRGRDYLLANFAKQKVISQYEDILQRIVHLSSST